MRGRRRFGVAIAAALSVMVLAGCTALDSGYAILDREAQSEDAVPETVSAEVAEVADLSTSRFVGEYESTSLWLLNGHDPGEECLLVYPDAARWVMGCAAEGLAVGAEGRKFLVQPDGAPAPADAVRISENVFYGERF